jgi:hypothetical protein
VKLAFVRCSPRILLSVRDHLIETVVAGGGRERICANGGVTRASASRIHANRHVRRRDKQNVVQRVTCDAGINEMAASELLMHAIASRVALG